MCRSPEDTERHKPDPEPARRQWSSLRQIKKTVFVGDSHFDPQRAGAGINTVFVKVDNFDRSVLPVPPTWTIESMQDLCTALPRRLAD